MVIRAFWIGLPYQLTTPPPHPIPRIENSQGLWIWAYPESTSRTGTSHGGLQIWAYPESYHQHSHLLYLTYFLDQTRTLTISVKGPQGCGDDSSRWSQCLMSLTRGGLDYAISFPWENFCRKTTCVYLRALGMNNSTWKKDNVWNFLQNETCFKKWDTHCRMSENTSALYSAYFFTQTKNITIRNCVNLVINVRPISCFLVLVQNNFLIPPIGETDTGWYF